MLQKLKNIRFNWYVIALIGIAIITHLEWFNLNANLYASDWKLWSDQSVLDYLNYGFGTWINNIGFGWQNSQLYFNGFKILWSIIVLLGGTANIAIQLTVFIPVALLSFLSPYLYIKSEIEDKNISFACAIFYGLSIPLLIEETQHLYIAWVYAFAPLILLYFKYLIKKFSFIKLLIFILLFSLGIIFEIRIMLILTVILIIYYLFFGSFRNIHKKRIIQIIIGGIMGILLHAYWILPTFLTENTKIQEYMTRPIFGDFMFDILSAFTLFEPTWTGSQPNLNFQVQVIPWYLWMVPIMLILSLIFYKKIQTKDKKLFWFFISLTILGLLITKQAGEPFSDLYSWLYKNMPAWNLYRVSTRFSVLLAIGYMGIIAIFFKSIILHNRKLKPITHQIILLSFVLLYSWNAVPLFTKDIQMVFKNKNASEEIKNINEYIESDNEIFKTLWIPLAPNGAEFHEKHPKISLIGLIKREYKFYPSYKTSSKANAKMLFEPLTKDYTNHLLNISNIKYIVIPPTLEEDGFWDYYNLSEKHIKEKVKYIAPRSRLENISIDGIEEFRLYKNPHYAPMVFGSQNILKFFDTTKYKTYEFEQVNPAHYKVHLKNLRKPFYLHLSQQDHKNWIAFTTTGSHPIKKVDSKMKFINSWYIDPQDIQNFFPTNTYILHEDGTIEIKVELFFKPHKYLVIGSYISVISLIFYLFTVLWLIYTKKYHKKRF